MPKAIATLLYIQAIIGVIMLIAGGLVYIVYRTTTLIMFRWLEYLCLDFSSWRMDSRMVPELVLYSLPDGLWLSSYILIVAAIWKNDFNMGCILCVSVLPVYALVTEFLQLAHVKTGVFDVNDLICYVLGIVFAIITIFIIQHFINKLTNKKL